MPPLPRDVVLQHLVPVMNLGALAAMSRVSHGWREACRTRAERIQQALIDALPIALVTHVVPGGEDGVLYLGDAHPSAIRFQYNKFTHLDGCISLPVRHLPQASALRQYMTIGTKQRCTPEARQFSKCIAVNCPCRRRNGIGCIHPSVWDMRWGVECPHCEVIPGFAVHGATYVLEKSARNVHAVTIVRGDVDMPPDTGYMSLATALERVSVDDTLSQRWCRLMLAVNAVGKNLLDRSQPRASIRRFAVDLGWMWNGVDTWFVGFIVRRLEALASVDRRIFRV